MQTCGKGEDFPAQIGRQSYEYLQRLLVEKSRQIALLNSTVSSGLKASWDDECYSLFYVTRGLCRMLGYTEEELMAKCRGRMTELVYPPDLPQALADCERLLANSLTYSTEYRMQRKDGKLIWVWDTGSKSKNEGRQDRYQQRHCGYHGTAPHQRYHPAAESVFPIPL